MDIIRLYVIWSPGDPVGLPLAEILAKHFDNADEAREFGGIRIPVFVRYEALSSASTAPRPIDLDEAEHNLVVAIGTHHLSDRIADDQRGAIGSTTLALGSRDAARRTSSSLFLSIRTCSRYKASRAFTPSAPSRGRSTCKAWTRGRTF